METLEKLLATKPTWMIGLIQTLSVIVYVAIFATIAFNMGQHIRVDNPILGIVTVLTAFVTSALICGSLVLGVPALLALRGQIKQAVQLVAWSSAWFAAILIVWVIILAAIS